jgi:hypothetical protein
MSGLQFLSPHLAAPEAVWRSPLERFLGEGIEDLSRLTKLEVRGELEPVNGEVVRLTPNRALVLCDWEDAPPGAIDVSAALAGLQIKDERVMRRLTDLDLEALPAAGAFARVEAIVLPGFRVFFPQEYGRYVCEAVLDALEGVR